MKCSICVVVIFLLCQAGFSQETTVDKAIRLHGNLLLMNKEISDLVARIDVETASTPSNRVFKAQQASWHVEIENLSNSYYYVNDEGLLKGLEQMLMTRIGVLDHIIKDDRYIREHAADYYFIEPWYLKEFENEYIGKTVCVFGSISIPDPSQPTVGVLTAVRQDDTMIKVVFKNMPKEQLLFIQRQNPISWHVGIATNSDSSFHLYITTLLGVQL